MKMRCASLLLLLMLCLAGCSAAQSGDYFAPFRGQFEAELAGEWQGEEISARLVQSAQGRTLTFYAPDTLCDTVLSCEVDGTLSLAVEELSVPLEGTRAAGYVALLDLFPTGGEVRTVTRQNDGIRVDGVGFSVTFAPDGTPLAASNVAANVRVTAWRDGG